MVKSETPHVFRGEETGPWKLGDVTQGTQESAFLLSTPQVKILSFLLLYPLLQDFIFFTKNPVPSNVPLF